MTQKLDRIREKLKLQEQRTGRPHTSICSGGSVRAGGSSVSPMRPQVLSRSFSEEQ